ncbi:hypothetical protein B2H97_00800 [Paraclostridium bifermentans]|uniref:hypothetical protein n=1 Tax=Paraclostridium bifermentans TaxID=1490 RepID=UPI000A174672|nr:hypothetical protein [Paraclostridium bifermentans]OSB11677.1 hypothetical protein B2H97_00800 [Paraclostridium bifermentans]
MDSIDSEYLTHRNACKLIKISYLAKTCPLDLFITCYLYNEKKYFKKDDIIYLSSLRDKLDKTINLCPVLSLKDPKAVKNFLEKKKIRFLPYGTHPFGIGHLYYKEDLSYIKELYSEFRNEVKNQQANLHKLSLKSFFENNKYNIKKGSSPLNRAIEIKISKIGDYFTVKETISLLQKEDIQPMKLYSFLTPYHFEYELYYKKCDVLDLVCKFENTTSVTSVSKIFGYSNSQFLNFLRDNLKISLIEPGVHPYGKRYLMYTDDIEKIKEYLIPQSDINLDDYISYQDTIKLFGVNTPCARISKFSAPIKYKAKLFYPKKDILMLLKYLKDTVTLLSLEKKYAELIKKKALRSLLIDNNIELIPPENHPFCNGILVYKNDLDKIDSIISISYKVNVAKNRYEKFKILISQNPLKESIKQTLEDFSNEFIYERFKSSKSESLHLSLYGAYNLLCSILKRNLYEYSKEDVVRFIEIVFNDDRYTGTTKIEFINFCNFSERKYNFQNSKPYVINTKKMTITHRDTSAYSKDQLLKLFGLLYCSIDNREYLCKALDNRNYAMVWLYMYMHYIVFWRASTIKDIPIPNLKLIGFSSGESFIKWCKEPSNSFTTEMGIKICASVKIQIDSLGITAKKNNKPLVFEHGRLMSRGLGFLLALCESHRQISEQNLKSIELKKKSGFGASKDVDRLITSNFRNKDHFIGLFGQKYTNILGEEIFSNLKAERAFNNYTLDFSDENSNAIGGQILSIMRSHVVNLKGVSNTTTTYETRVKEGTIAEVESTLQEIGAFGFAKHALLSICDNEYKLDTLTNKNKKMLSLSMTPIQIESISKSVYNQRETVLKILNKMIVNPNIAKNVLQELAYGRVAGKHQHSRCLLKAIINTNTYSLNFAQPLDLVINYDYSQNCLMPDSDSCFSCPLLIGEMYLLYELDEIICDSIKHIFSSKNSFECYIQSSLMFKSYLPILYAAQDVLGEDIVCTHINIDYISSALEQLEVDGKLLFELT